MLDAVLDSLKFLRNEPLEKHCRFHIGGPADYYVEVTNAAELNAAINFARGHNLRRFIYSGGSNLFFDDDGYRGLVIRFIEGGFAVSDDRRRIGVSAGYDLPALIRELAQHGIGGLEFLGNIPGSVGGAVVGNAGCYGKEIASFLISAGVYDTSTGEVIHKEPSFFEFSYRHSKLKYDPRFIVVSATMHVSENPTRFILEQVEGELAQRLAKHPHDAWCGGSFFKNPGKDNPAWLVIKDAGIDGSSVGGALLSPKHPNFLINGGDACSRDILDLARMVQANVKQKLKIDLIPEVRYVSPEGLQEI